MRRLNRWLFPLAILGVMSLSSPGVAAPAGARAGADASADAGAGASAGAGAKPPPPHHRLRLAYFVPNDRQPTANYQQKIRVVMSIVAELYLQDLRGKKYQTDGLRFESETDEKDKPLVQLVRGARDAVYYNNAPRYDANEQWRRMNPEIRRKIGNPQQQVIVVFAETYDDGPAEHLWPGVIARGGYNSADGGLALFSAHLLRDELCALTVAEQRKRFFDQTPVPGRTAWGHRMNSPRGTFAEDGVGAVAHELGHALGLPHDRRDDAHDIMGNGFRNLRWNFAPQPKEKERVCFSDENARLLMSSRYLAGDLDLSDRQPPKVEVTSLTGGRGGGEWTVSVKASDNTGLRAVVFLDRAAGSVIAGRKLTGVAQEFRQPLTAMDAKSQPLKLQLIVTDAGGNQTRLSHPGAELKPR